MPLIRPLITYSGSVPAPTVLGAQKHHFISYPWLHGHGLLSSPQSPARTSLPPSWAQTSQPVLIPPAAVGSKGLSLCQIASDRGQGPTPAWSQV